MKLNKAVAIPAHRTYSRSQPRSMRLCKGPCRCPGRHPHGDRTGCCSEAHHARTYHASTRHQHRPRPSTCSLPHQHQPRLRRPLSPRTSPAARLSCSSSTRTSTTGIIRTHGRSVATTSAAEATAGGSPVIPAPQTSASVPSRLMARIRCRPALTAVQNEGPVKYEGTYTVSGGVIVAANVVQTG